jgi:hypothetical protein
MEIEEHKSPVVPIILSVLISALVFGGLGYYFGQSMASNTTQTTTYSSPTATATTTATATPTPSPTASAAATDTTNWKTYTSPKYGYTFKYDPSISIGESSTDETTTVTEGTPQDHWAYALEVSTASQGMTLDQAANQAKAKFGVANSKITVTDTTIGGKTAKRISAKDVGDYGNVSIVLLLNNRLYTISGDDSTPKSKAGFDLFLTTIAFK